MRQAYGLFNIFISGQGIAVTHVLKNAVIEQHGILGHDADGSAQGVLAQLTDILVVDGNVAAVGIVEAEQEFYQGRFA